MSIHRSIVSPYFIDAVPYPYLRGPNYERPMFREYSRNGNFKSQPITVMPSAGFGATPGTATTATVEVVGGPNAPPPAPMALTPDMACSSLKTAPNLYSDCVKFNAAMLTDLAAHPDKGNEYNAKLKVASDKCGDQLGQNMGVWAACYYGELNKPAWYLNPLYLGAGALGLGVLALVLTSTRRGEY